VATPSSNNGTVTGLQPNRTYYLFVNSCESVCSNYYSLGSTVTLANPPVSLSSGSVTETTVGLSFSANGNPAGTTYLVQKATAIGGPYSTVLTTTLVAPTITDLAVGTTYLFQVLARNLSGTTTTSVGPVSVMTGLTTPDLILETVGASSAQLTIVPKGNPAGTVYVLQQSGDNGGTFTNVSTGMDLLVTVTGLSAGKSYQFRVAALDQFGNSTTPSGVVLATPAKFSAETARAYPVPFRSKLGQNTITFDQLPSGATVKLFSMKGQLVRTLSVDGGTQVDWDVKNQDGQPVVSGVYLALIDANGSQKTLKVAVQR
jgi:hypothetical protein